MKISIQDILDRCSILHLKIEHGGFKPHWVDELAKLEEEIQLRKKKEKGKADLLEQYFSKLKAINGAIWDLESDIRSGLEAELGYEEVGRRAVEIRKLNDIRVEYKNEIGREFGEGFFEEKIIK